MRIYTRTGDDGSTGLFGGARTTKADPRVETCGTLDEANSALGLARSFDLPHELDQIAASLQTDLFALGAELSCAPGSEARLGMPLLDQRDVERLEETIDAVQAELAPLKTFILPGGAPAAAALHLARSIVRRAERIVVREGGQLALRADVLKYLNRASDLLFVLARRANQAAGRAEMPWNPPRCHPL
jgi:cob(I)alamin adenosyltransferase